MIIRSEQDIADHVADGRLTVEDADVVRTFALWLREKSQLAELVDRGPDYHAARAAYWARWSGYLAGTADGPAEATP